MRISDWSSDVCSSDLAILRTRQLDARYHQTFAALLATNAALTFLLVPFFAQIAPMLRELASHPEMLEPPESVKLPPGIAFIMNALNLLSFAVTASLFRPAANVSMDLGLLIALVIEVGLLRAEEGRVRKEGVSPCRYVWAVEQK